MKPPVLLLDDDRRWLQICLARLPQTDYTLEPTAALSDALERLTTIRHPVVICDLRLIGIGERGGFELLVRAKTISEFTKVIIVTAYGGAATDIAREAMEKGAITYLTKPLDFAELDRCITMAIQSWRQEVEEMKNLGFLADGPELAFLQTAEMPAHDRAVPVREQPQVPDASLTRGPSNRRTRAALRQILAERFDEEGLRTLCFDLDVDYDDLPAHGKAGKARELIKHLERHGRVLELVEAGRGLRLDIPWDDVFGGSKGQEEDA